MHSHEEGEEARGNYCIMGNILATQAYSSISKGGLGSPEPALTISFIKEEKL